MRVSQPISDMVEAALEKGRWGEVQALVVAGNVHPGFEPPNYRRSLVTLAAEAPAAKEALAYLLKADPGAAKEPGPGGWTPLHYASRLGNIDAVKLLLAAGADMDAREERGASALDLAARRNCTPIVRMLLVAGADESGLVTKEGEIRMFVRRRPQIANLVAAVRAERAMTRVAMDRPVSGSAGALRRSRNPGSGL